jgi:hypothetical protein
MNETCPEAERESLYLLSPQNVSALFEPYTERRIQLQIDPRLPDPRFGAVAERVRQVFRAFTIASRRLTMQGNAPKVFGTLGVGSGIEAIGAAHIFPELDRIVATDRDPLLLAEAAINIRFNIESRITVAARDGNIFAPLVSTGGWRVDLLYADLSDIPFTTAPEAIVERRAYCPPVARTAHDDVLNDYQLGLPYHFLRSGLSALSPRGAMLIALGGRFPYGVFDQLADAAGLRFTEILCALRRQADDQAVISGFAAVEAASAGFEFYDFDAAHGIVGDMIINGDAMKSLLARHRLSAQAALQALGAGRSIGHTIHLILATPIPGSSVPPSA